MNLGVITHIEADKHLNVLTISTAYHIPAFIEEHLTEMIHHDVTNLYGLLHLIILAIHSVANHQHTCSGCHTG